MAPMTVSRRLDTFPRKGRLHRRQGSLPPVVQRTFVFVAHHSPTSEPADECYRANPMASSVFFDKEAALIPMSLSGEHHEC